MIKQKVWFIAPYAAMQPLIQEVKENFPALDVTVRTGNLQEGAAIARQAEKEGARVIISRGGTAELIRQAVAVPVVNVQMSGYDLLRAVVLAAEWPGKKAIIGFSAVTIGAESILALLDVDMDVFTIRRAEEVEPLISRLKTEGYARIIGDTITYEAARRHGIEGMLIQSGRESITAAFETAEKELAAGRKTYYALRAFRRLLTERETDFVLTGAGGDILFEQMAMFPACPLSAEELADQLAEGPGSRLRELDGRQTEVTVFRLDESESVSGILFRPLDMPSGEPDQVSVEEIRRVPPLVHESAAMKRIVRAADKPSASQSLVLLEGEPGTGKELLAKYIHAAHGKTGLFASVRLAGHNHTFTRLSGHLPRHTSTLLLQLEESGRDGGPEEIRSWIRLCRKRGIQLMLACEQAPDWLRDAFRDEPPLVFRMPPLSERTDDIPGLALACLTAFHQELGTQPVRVREDALELLQTHSWPRNADSLTEALKFLALSEKGYVIGREAVEAYLARESTPNGQATGFSLEGTMKDIEKRILQQILEEENFNQTEAARRLNISRATLWRKLKE